MKKVFIILSLTLITGCAELQRVAQQLPQTGTYVSRTEIAAGLREALTLGVERQVSKLAAEGGFFRNELVRIELPPKLQKVDQALRDIGLDGLADEGLRVLNTAAADAVKEATPVFVNAIQQISFQDAQGILTRDSDAATTYLAEQTSDQLYQKFHPVIQNSLEEVGATKLWSKIINRYNQIPLTSKINPDLAEYVTHEALEGVFIMIALEEKSIRSDLSSRTTALLKRVFALQDNSN